ncbi:Hypothetical protein AA314_01468 [Archangium gephyra]|uniref:Uncharacterized protein n=1 Tax=Archangium gephyra TaxID=48 RepID=A0AAC8Q2U3_9BACT|nr:Hypothetical protein AA314_01468 [Archangium gephyra]
MSPVVFGQVSSGHRHLSGEKPTLGDSGGGVNPFVHGSYQ